MARILAQILARGCQNFGRAFVARILAQMLARILAQILARILAQILARVLAQILARGCQNSLIDLYIRPHLPETRTWKHMHVLSPKVAQTKSANYFTTVVIN